MSTSEPFMPAHEPRRDEDPRDREIDSDVDSDVNETTGVPDAVADAALVAEPHGRPSALRTPSPGHRLGPEDLERELNDSTD
ncbi:hypothetical protein ELQ90_01900 [Labedella phragmitis]|uniref:Uncharacterized protein n=1 Tax=Labedella phragmitis TaxID=2498849 RepID=A0A444PXX7_9MICO|nr:hypothetical protein [Labedella phragmitis]RWZ52724.1 hypothetical protein ELQ90_01900 [Labedella phragmitis]